MNRLIYLLDTYAWIEYFKGSEKGRKIHFLFNSSDHVFITLECNIAELYEWSHKNEQHFDKLFEIVKVNSSIIPIMLKTWLTAIEIKLEQTKSIADFGLMDALLVAKQKEIKAIIITGDKHFKHMKKVLFLN